MSRYRFRHATRCSAAGVAALAAMILLQVPAAHAGEAVISNCLHGFRSGYSFNDSQSYGREYGSDFGRSYSRSFSEDGSRGRVGGFFRRRFGGGFRRFDARGHAGFGGGSESGSAAASANGYGGGSSSAYGGGASSGFGADSCVEVRREVGNPYVISIRPPQGEEEYRDFLDRDRLWRDRCHPVVKQDTRGIARYVYSAPGCDYGRYE